LRRRSRALSLLGFRELATALFVRPDNLAAGLAGVRERLSKLGLEPQAPVFLAQGFSADQERRARTLWNGKALTRSYVQTRQRLEKWLARAPRLTLELAARESFLLGSTAIRQVVFDPLLPEPLVEVGERRAFIELVRRFDDVGHAIWRELLSRGARGDARADLFSVAQPSAPAPAMPGAP
jgi:phenylacetic acid degradation operon negative regulatory protein